MTIEQSNQMAPMFSVRGWTVVVTGASAGIGLALARALTRQGAARVYIASRRFDALETIASGSNASEIESGELVPLEMDVTDRNSIRKAAQTVRERDDHIHLLVNNAGHTSKRAPIKGVRSPEELSKAMLDVDLDDWDRAFAINVRGPYLVTAAFLPLLARASAQIGGDIASVVNISSIYGQTGSTRLGHFAYNTSKASTDRMSHLLAVELSRPSCRVRVNTLAPGFCDHMDKHMDRVLQSPTGDKNWSDVPAGRPASQQDLVRALLSLATQPYVNGQHIQVDGGWSLTNL